MPNRKEMEGSWTAGTTTNVAGRVPTRSQVSNECSVPFGILRRTATAEFRSLGPPFSSPVIRPP